MPMKYANQLTIVNNIINNMRHFVRVLIYTLQFVTCVAYLKKLKISRREYNIAVSTVQNVVVFFFFFIEISLNIVITLYYVYIYI